MFLSRLLLVVHKKKSVEATSDSRFFLLCILICREIKCVVCVIIRFLCVTTGERMMTSSINK